MVIRVLPCDKDKLIYNFFDIFGFVQNDVIKNTQQNQDIVLIEVYLRRKKNANMLDLLDTYLLFWKKAKQDITQFMFKSRKEKLLRKVHKKKL